MAGIFNGFRLEVAVDKGVRIARNFAGMTISTFQYLP
jgi:hypothetical protein